MGTNFYWIKEEKPACECCKRPYEEKNIHIGKSSAGWCFSLHVDPSEGINSLADWQKKWLDPESRIENEYGDVIAGHDMLGWVTERGWPNAKDLQRHTIDGRHCIAHGDGTYDLIAGEFS